MSVFVILEGWQGQMSSYAMEEVLLEPFLIRTTLGSAIMIVPFLHSTDSHHLEYL